MLWQGVDADADGEDSQPESFGQPIFVVGKWHAATLTAPTPTSRKLIQKHVADNDAEAFGKVMTNKTWGSSMPPDQLRRRAERLKVFVKSAK